MHTEFKDGSRLKIMQYEDDKLRCTWFDTPSAPLWYSRTITLVILNQLEDNHFQHCFTLVDGQTEEISLPFLGHNSAVNYQYLQYDVLYVTVSTSTTRAYDKASISD